LYWSITWRRGSGSPERLAGRESDKGRPFKG
jgi:hypothetical protein